ncbi:MAG TPA: TadE/TadG family type IV pilus assembly protein [Marmoricola sp.]|nr:TadE/TadG family type IV pilus assembly protein [Marmoricola sp.]
MERSHRKRCRRSQRGAVAVETALVMPLLMAVLFGIVEVSLLIRDHVAITSAVRVGSRIASAAADAGPGTCLSGQAAATCTPTSSPALAQQAADAIQRAGSAMPPDQIDYILVYKANREGYPGPDGNTTMPSSCGTAANCVKFVWRDSANAFRYDGGSWDSKSINACVNESDTLGVHMHATHKFITGIFGATLGLADRSVMRFEPLPEDSCKPGTVAAHS